MNNELYHHGVKGQKWGVRRYQNEDGSYTPAGRKRYGLDLDLNDKSRTNIARIRLGEARRRLDVAKSNNSTSAKIAELKSRERMAKNAIREAKRIDAGEKRAEKGETIHANALKSTAAYGAALVGSQALTKHLNTRLRDLSAAGRVTPGHYAVAKASNIIGGYAAYGLAAGYSMKKSADSANIRKYQDAKTLGSYSNKSIGSIEYAARIRRAKKARNRQGDTNE